MVEESKSAYLKGLGTKVHDASTSKKCYWKIINKVLNKSKSPIIPPLLVNKTFIFDCAEKAKHFIDLFSRQCLLIANDSISPLFNYRTM